MSVFLRGGGKEYVLGGTVRLLLECIRRCRHVGVPLSVVQVDDLGSDYVT